ncbi:MAG: type II toxin-antitoxin system RelE/ParE family toxin [Candidatus Omnitrophica bacterium]|nr:type II toxin-antitoxin system RelE/ParE family toxin [Candidatus Omnitrophota bacterium]
MSFNSDKHVAYIGREFCIEWYVDAKGASQALDFAETMPPNYIAKLMHLFEVMGDVGTIYNKTKFRNEGGKIYAFKPQPYRFLSFFTCENKIIITNGFYKKQMKLPNIEKQRALKAMNDYLQRVREGKYYD